MAIEVGYPPFWPTSWLSTKLSDGPSARWTADLLGGQADTKRQLPFAIAVFENVGCVMYRWKVFRLLVQWYIKCLQTKKQLITNVD